MTDKKLTDNEIVKALECCTTNVASCKNCPAFVKVDRSNCKKYFRGALDLINRLQAELKNNENIIRLADKTIATANAEIERLKQNLEEAHIDIREQLAEIDRLRNTIAVFTNNAVDFADEIDRHKKDKEEVMLFASNIVEAEKIVIAEAKAEAHKEFAERLNKEFHEYRKQYKEVANFDGAAAMLIAKRGIEIVLKEMEGGASEVED